MTKTNATRATDVAVIPPTRYEADDEEHAAITAARALVVTDAASYAAAGAMVVGLKRVLRNVESHYEKIKKPINALRAIVLGMEKTDSDIVQKAIDTIEPKAKAWKFEQDAKDAAERRRLQAIEDEKVRKQQAEAAAAMQRVAKAEPDPTMRKALTQEARAIAKAPVAAARMEMPSSVPVVGGLSYTTRYKAEVFDAELLALAVARDILAKRFKGNWEKALAVIDATEGPFNALVANMPYLNDRATRDKDTLNIAGVRVVKDTGMVGR